MRWDVHINRRRKGRVVTETHTVEVPGTHSMADSRGVCAVASKHYGASMDATLCVPHHGTRHPSVTLHIPDPFAGKLLRG